MKKKTLLIIIISLIVLIVVAGGVFTYLFLATDLFKSDKQLFLKYAVNMADNKNDINVLDSYNNKKKTMAYENSGSFTVNTELMNNSTSDIAMQMVQSVINFGNDTNISFSGKVDNANKKVEENVQINYSDNVNFPFTYKQEGEIYGIKADIVTPNYIAIQNNNLPELLQKFGVTDVTNIPNKLEAQEIQSLKLTDEEKTHILNTYIMPMINGIADEKFSKEENNDKSVSYTLTLTYQEINNIIAQMLQTLSTDTMMINKINTILQELYQNQNMKITSEDIQKVVNNINAATIDDGVATIKVVQKDGKTMSLSVNANELTLKFEKVLNNSNVVYNISLTDNKGNAFTIGLSYSGIDTDSVFENFSVNISAQKAMNVSYTFENTVTFGNQVSIEPMDLTKTAVLNNYPAEQVQPFMTQLGNVITKINTNQMTQIGYPTDMVNPMVMWFTMPVYLQIYNSASESIQNNNLSEQEKDANNMEFESYKGQIKGSQVKNLCDKVRIKGLDGMSNKINVKLGSPASATSFVDNVNDVDTIKSSILSGKTYNVTLSYDTATGYVCEIGIEEIN